MCGIAALAGVVAPRNRWKGLVFLKRSTLSFDAGIDLPASLPSVESNTSIAIGQTMPGLSKSSRKFPAPKLWTIDLKTFGLFIDPIEENCSTSDEAAESASEKSPSSSAFRTAMWPHRCLSSPLCRPGTDAISLARAVEKSKRRTIPTRSIRVEEPSVRLSVSGNSRAFTYRASPASKSELAGCPLAFRGKS